MKFLWAVPLVVIIFAVHFVIGIIPFFILRLFALKKAARAWLGFTTKYGSELILKLLGVEFSTSIDPEAEKLIKGEKTVCFVSNHTSFLDTIFILRGVRGYLGFVIKKSIEFLPLVNMVAFAMGCIFVDRNNMQKSADGIRRGVKKIKKGNSMLIFPEGTRSKTGAIGTFRYGAFRLAYEAEVPVIPVVIKGVRQALEDRKKCFVHCKAQLCVLKPVLISSSESRAERFDKIESIENNVRETYASLGD